MRYRSLFFILLGAIAHGPLDAAPLEEGWEQAAALFFNSANTTFENATSLSPMQERERSLGLAVTLLNVQPRVQRNLHRARELLQKLAIGPEDDIAISSRYFLARMNAFYEAEPRKEEARALYRSLIERHSGHLLAEYGASQWVLMELYDDIPHAQRAERFLAMEQIAPLLKTAAGRRSYHLNMGNAYIDFGTDNADTRSNAIRHLLAADAEGIPRWQVEAANWIAIGELARAEGRSDLAKAFYGKFLAKYKRDNRHYTIQQRLESLSGSVQ